MFGLRPPVDASPPLVGLIVPGKNEVVPLKNVSVQAKLSGYVVGIASVLKYSNEGTDPLEVVFRFPVDESMAVVGLEAVINGKRIKAEIKEKEEAKQDYDDAMASGFTAALAEKATGDIFSISLGNFPPKSVAEIHLQLVGELPLDAEGAIKFTLPTVLKPRYVPAGSTDPLFPLNQHTNYFGSTTRSQNQQGTAPAVLDFTLDVMKPAAISEVTSPTHVIETESDPIKIHVSLGTPKPLADDLVILVTQSDPHTPTAIPEPGDANLSQRKYMGSPAVMLNFFPKFATKRAACEFIFVVDRSGSMSGEYMKSARETLILFLKSIPPGCSFNIIGFGSSYQVLFAGSEPYNQFNLDKAVAHAEKMFANLGGTELLNPLQYINSQPLLPGLPRQVFVLTDGSVSNTYGCIQEVKKNVTHTRVFTFGIGSGASTELVRGLARAGNGTAEFIQKGERMQPKVISSLKRSLQPSVTDVDVNFDLPSSFESIRAPANIPTLYSGDKVTIYGIFKSKALSDEPLQTSVSGTATLRGKILGRPIEHLIHFDVPEPLLDDYDDVDNGLFDMPVVHQLASKSLIRDWQDSHTGGSADDRKKEIIDLSIESCVISSHTAYIAVDEDQEKTIDGAVKVWDIVGTIAAREQASPFSFGGGGGLSLQNQSVHLLSFGGPPPPQNRLYGRQVPAASACFSSNLSGGLFGGLSTMGGGPQPPPNQAGGLDLLTGPPPPSGGLLGGPPPPSGGGLLGGPPPPSGGGLFGGSLPPSSQTGGLFGGPLPRNQTGGLFGQTGDLFGGPPLSSSQTGGLFGGPPPLNQTGGLFGGPQPTSSQTGGLFGTPPPSNQTGGLFGGPLPLNQTGGLFGGPQPTSSQTGGLFGAPPPSNQTGGLFGEPPPRNQTGDLFGGPPPPSSQSGGLFSGLLPPSKQTGGFFGGPPPPSTQADGLFGGPPPPSSLSLDPFCTAGHTSTLNSFGASSQMSSVNKGHIPPPSDLTKIISLQQAEGFWHLEDVASQILQKPMSKLVAGSPIKCDSAIWATILVLVYLECKFANHKDEWELVALKADWWIENQNIATVSVLKEAATKCISN